MKESKPLSCELVFRSIVFQQNSVESGHRVGRASTGLNTTIIPLIHVERSIVSKRDDDVIAFCAVFTVRIRGFPVLVLVSFDIFEVCPEELDGG